MINHSWGFLERAVVVLKSGNGNSNLYLCGFVGASVYHHISDLKIRSQTPFKPLSNVPL